MHPWPTLLVGSDEVGWGAAKTLGRALDKAEIQGFYLGLEWDWLDDNVMAAPPVGDDEDWSEDSEDMDGDDK